MDAEQFTPQPNENFINNEQLLLERIGRLTETMQKMNDVLTNIDEKSSRIGTLFDITKWFHFGIGVTVGIGSIVLYDRCLRNVNITLSN